MSTDKKPWWKQGSLREAVGGEAQQRFGGVVLEGETLIYEKTRYPVAGVVARVESVGELRSRVTATRLLTTGIFAFALKKKTTDRELYLTFTGATFEFVVELNPKKGAEARAFAAKINTLAAKGAIKAPSAPEGTAPPAGWFADPLDATQLRWWDGSHVTQHTRPIGG